MQNKTSKEEIARAESELAGALAQLAAIRRLRRGRAANPRYRSRRYRVPLSLARWTIATRTYAEIAVGETVTVTQVVTVTDVEALALAAGNVEAFHLEGGKATHDGVAAQGAASVALIAGAPSHRLPGPGSRIVGTRFEYGGTINVGDALTVTVTAKSRQDETHSIEFACHCANQRGDVLATGVANVTAATGRIADSDLATPDRILRRNDGFAGIFAACESLPAVSCAVVHPCDRDSLLGAIEAARIGLIVPVLVGPSARIRATAKAEGVDLSAYRVVSTEHSHAAAAAAVAMARTGEVEALMKGSLHTDELMSAVVPDGARTAHRASHQPRVHSRCPHLSAAADDH